MEGTVCKYFQTGYFKFRVNWRKHHVIEICPEEHCNKRKCDKRHPKACKHFSTQLACRLGNKCCYKHVTPPNKSDTTGLEIKISQLEDCIKNMSAQIINLERNIEAIKKSLANKFLFECDECGYQASSQSVLKRYMTMKHPITKTPEKLRDSDLNNSLQVSPVLEQRSENTLVEEASVKEAFKCQYWACKYKCNTLNELAEHVKLKYTVDETFLYPNSSEEIECPEFDKIFSHYPQLCKACI